MPDADRPATDDDVLMPGDVPPIESIKMILGDCAQTALLLYLYRQQRAVAARELVTALDDYDRETIADEIDHFAQFGVVTCPSVGRYRLAYGPVGMELGDLIDALADAERERRGLAPLAEVVGCP